jgi:hypothetical protein
MVKKDDMVGCGLVVPLFYSEALEEFELSQKKIFCLAERERQGSGLGEA